MAIVIGILKLILILLAVLVIAALVIIALILFAPIRYKVQGSFTDEIPSARAEAKWLAGLLNVRVAYDKEAGISAYVAVFSHKIYDILGDDADANDAEENIAGQDITESYAGADDVSRNHAAQESADKHISDAAKTCADGSEDKSAVRDGVKLYDKDTDSDNTDIIKADTADTAAGTAQDIDNGSETAQDARKRKLRISVYEAGRPVKRRISELKEKGISFKTVLASPFRAARKALQRAADALSRGADKAEAKLKDAACRIKEIITGIIAVIRMRSTQFRELKAVWDDKRYAKGKALLLDRIVKLLSELKPRHGSGHIRIGRGDPYSTAQAAQLAAFLYPFYADTIEFIPDFDQSILEGSIDVGGRLRLIIPAEAALRIYFSKELKAMYVRARRILDRE